MTFSIDNPGVAQPPSENMFGKNPQQNKDQMFVNSDTW